MSYKSYVKAVEYGFYDWKNYAFNTLNKWWNTLPPLLKTNSKGQNDLEQDINQPPMLMYTKCWRCHSHRPDNNINQVSSLRGKYCNDCYSFIYQEMLDSMINKMFGKSCV